MNKKLFKFSLVLCTSVLMAISCNKKETTNPELPSMGTLSTKSGSILTLNSKSASGTETSGAIEVSGFSDSFKTAAKKASDITYKVKTVNVTGITTGAAAKDLPALKKEITVTTFKVETQDTFDKIKIGFAGDQAQEKAKAIATAIEANNTGNITLTVEASPDGATAGKYASTTFEVRLGIKVTATKDE